MTPSIPLVMSTMMALTPTASSPMGRPGVARPGVLDSNSGCLNCYRLTSLNGNLFASGYERAKQDVLPEYGAAIAEAARLRSSSKEKDAQLNAAVAEASACRQQLALETARAAAAEAAAEAMTANKLAAEAEAAKAAAKAAKAAATAQKKHEKDMGALKAVHAATIHRRVQEEGRVEDDMEAPRGGGGSGEEA